MFVPFVLLCLFKPFVLLTLMKNSSDLNGCIPCFAGFGVCVCSSHAPQASPELQFGLTVLWVLCFEKYRDKTSLKKRNWFEVISVSYISRKN